MNIGNKFICHNQTNDCIVLGDSGGFEVYQADPYIKKFRRNIENGVNIIKMLYKTNLILYVDMVDKNKVNIWDDIQRKHVGKIILKREILNFELDRNNIVVVCIDSIYIYDFNKVSLINTIPTVNNPDGICCLINDKIVYPDKEVGGIVVYDKSGICIQNVIKAHTSPLKCIASCKNTFASCSIKGTVLRIYNLDTCELIKEFRRGVEATDIHELKFSRDGLYLICISNKKTIHIYDIYTPIVNTILPKYVSDLLPQYSTTKIYPSEMIFYTVPLEQNNRILAFTRTYQYVIEFDKN